MVNGLDGVALVNHYDDIGLHGASGLLSSLDSPLLL